MNTSRFNKIRDKIMSGNKDSGGVKMRVNWETLERALRQVPGGLSPRENLSGVDVDPHGITITIEHANDS